MNKFSLVSFVLLAQVMAALPVWADRPIVADLAVRSIDIDHEFTGIDILLFGARNDIGDLVIVVRGPEMPHVVRRKERKLGMWLNQESVTFHNVAQFYSIASTKPLHALQNDYLLSQLQIGVDALSPVSISAAEDITQFKHALTRIKQESNLYSSELQRVTFWGETLFRTVLKFPKNIPRGDYTAEVYLFSGGQLQAVQSTPLRVSKIGFEAFIFDLAHQYSWLYGLMAIAMAVFAGLGASFMFRRF